MEKRKLNRHITSGLLVYSAANIASHLLHVPELFRGLGYGLAISLMLFGMLSEKFDLNRIRIFKRNIAAKLFGFH